MLLTPNCIKKFDYAKVVAIKAAAPSNKWFSLDHLNTLLTDTEMEVPSLHLNFPDFIFDSSFYTKP